MVTSLHAAGSNSQGQLASGNLEDASLFRPCLFSGYDTGILPPDTTKIVNIASGANHTLLLLERSDKEKHTLDLWGCGDDRKGQLGSAVADTAESSSQARFRQIDLGLDRSSLEEYTPRLIAASWETTFVVLSYPDKDDVLISMGSNDYGDLGVGDVDQGSSLAQIHRIDLSQIVKTSSRHESTRLVVEDLTAGPHHIIAHLLIVPPNNPPKQVIIGWGASRHGQLGPPNLNSSGRALPIIPKPQIIPIDPTLGTVIKSACGNQHTVFLRDSGRVSAFGSNRKGQLNALGALRDVQSVGCTWNGTYAIVLGGEGERKVWCTGSHSRGQLGRTLAPSPKSQTDQGGFVHFPFGSTLPILRNLICGSEHVLCLVDKRVDTEIWGWGWNEHGNLGIGTTDDTPVPTKLWPKADDPNPSRCTNMWAGCATSWLVLNKSEL
ncbi:hypothetical protein JAAARDRAFT_119797 [Jaapia argillacea MUCL 33604]|uniref:RCC1/BLIP-II protein n=1 Tax=Jaapia argillacea MUCL 33604 TaxID=933084 RepID=A0A067Q7B5_9AGAM|nr:hypothetical protein JAAARDRAFT_119797 [Jaapia argillacea MUCL 33604]